MNIRQYIYALYDLEKRVLPGVKAGYSKTEFKQTVIDCAKAWDVPAEVVWGVMYRESKHVPVGIFSKRPKPEAAASIPTSAFGMAQVTFKSRFKKEKKLLGEAFPFQHHHLILPEVTAWYIAASYARLYARTRTPSAVQLGDWWAGKDRGERKYADIVKHGPNVYRS